jgi:hypothetical protein
MKNFVYVAGFLLLLLSFESCKRVKPEPPAASTLDTLLQPPLSVLYVPVQYRVSAFEDMINEKIQGTFVNKWIMLGEKGDSLHLSVSKIRRITLGREERTISIVVPIHISGIVRANVAGIKIKNETPVEAEIDIHLASAFHMDTSWNMISNSALQKIVWKQEPKLKVGFVHLNLKGPIENMLRKKESNIEHKIDEALLHAINTHKVVTKLWQDIQKPIVINKKGKMVWLKAYGQDLGGVLQKTDEDIVSLLFELKTYTRIYYEGDSIPPSNPVLPPFKRIKNNSDSLNIYVHSLLRFDMINDLLNKELNGKELSAKGFSTTIKKVRVYGTQSGLAIELKVKGDIDGTLYVKGTPAYDSLTSSFSMKDFDFDISSESALLNSADWIMHSKVLDLVAEKLTVNITPLAAKLPDIIFKAIEKGKTGEKIDLLVDTLSLQPMAIVPTKDNLQLLVHARGRAKVVLDDRIFNKKDKRASVN